MNITHRGMLVASVALFALLLCASPALAADKNHNKIPDSWEKAHHLSLTRNQAKSDFDHDGLNNYNEWRAHTNPRVKDTNHNGVSDAKEDYDHDHLTNLGEVKSHTNIRVADTNHNGVSDAREDPDHDRLRNAQEMAVGTNPLKADSDGDGVTDGREDRDEDGLDNEAEFAEGTNPNKSDSDSDGVEDGQEIAGIIVSFDETSGILSLKSFNESGTVFDVTVNGDTKLEWARDSDSDEPTMGALVPGAVIKEVETEDGSTVATKIEIRRPGRDGSLVARIAEFDSEDSVLTLEASHDQDCEFKVLVTDATVFAWADGVTPDHVAGVGDLVEGMGIAAYETVVDGDGHQVAAKLVLVPKTSSDFVHEDD